MSAHIDIYSVGIPDRNCSSVFPSALSHLRYGNDNVLSGNERFATMTAITLPGVVWESDYCCEFIPLVIKSIG